MANFLNDAAGLSKKDKVRTVLKIADLAVKLGISLSPGANAVYEATKISLEAARDYVQARNEKRVIDFHRTLLYRDGVNNKEIINAELNAADFHALLDACVSDIEEEKTSSYANLTRAIALDLVPVTHRRHFIHSLKELAFEHLDILREAYTLTRYSCISHNKLATPKDFFIGLQTDSISQLALTALIARGLIRDVKITALGVKFIESCYPPQDLEPYNFNYTYSTRKRAVIIKLGDSQEIKSIESSLINDLKNRLIQTETADMMSFDGSESDDPYVKFATYAFVIGFLNSVYNQGVSDTLNKSLSGKSSLQVFFDDSLLVQEEPTNFMDAPSKIIIKDRTAKSASEAVDFVMSLK